MKINFTHVTHLTALALIVLFGTMISVAQKPVSKQEKAAIEKIVREYLLNNPKVLREAMQALEQQEAKDRREALAKNLKSLKTDIYYDVTSPVAGNPNGDVTVVVFFDYNCGYCKQTLPDLDVLLKKDPQLRVIYKEFPIMSNDSQFAAQAAMAAAKQGKYLEFHRALVSADSATEVAIRSISDRLKLDYPKLQADMKDPKLNEALLRNNSIASQLGINGTPAYIVGDQIIPGAIDAGALANLVAFERSKLSGAKAQKTAAMINK